MVESDVKDRDTRVFELRPNYSLTQAGAIVSYLLISGVTLSVAAAFALMGLWPVLPFAGLEVLVLGIAFYLCARQARRRELITVADQTVCVSTSGGGLGQVSEFPRGWVQVVLQPSRIKWYPSRLLIRAHGKELEIGSFLAEDERQRLAEELRQAVAWG